MSEQAHHAVSVSEPTPVVVARLLDVVADHRVDHRVDQALCDMEQVIARLRADAEEAAEARDLLRNTPVAVPREALRLRAGPIQSGGIATGRIGTGRSGTGRIETGRIETSQ